LFTVVTRRHARVLARLTGTRAAERSVVFFADQGRVILALFVLSVLSSTAVAVGPFVLRHLIDDALPTGEVSDLVVPVLLLCAVGVFEAGMLSMRMALIARLGALVMVRMRRAVNAHIQRLPFGYFPRAQQGEVMTVLSTDTVNAQNAISATVQAVVCRISDMAVGVAVVFVLDWQLSLVVVLFAPATLLIVRRGRRQLAEISGRRRELDAALMNQVADTASVSGALHVRLFDRADYEQHRFDTASTQALTAADRQGRLTSRVRFMVMTGIALTMTMVVTIGAWLVSSERTTLGTVAALGAALLVSFGPLISAVDLRSELSAAGASLDRVFAFLDHSVDDTRGRPVSQPMSQPAHRSASQPALVRQRTQHPHAPRATATPVASRTANRTELCLDGVWFSYDLATTGAASAAGATSLTGLTGLAGATGLAGIPGDMAAAREAGGSGGSGGSGEGPAWTLRGVDLRVTPGTTTAIVGSSGAGKTTVAYLASGMYRPQRGQVTLGGVPLQEIPREELHAAIGVVPQDPHLFHDTIAANVRYGRLDASDDEVRAALEAACLGPLLDRMPDGLQTKVGARGYRLSGGERQRMAIARVLLQSPQVLVLDEATSALDTVSETMVREALDRLATGRTCLVIAHRLSTVMSADRIHVMEHGRVVEAGTHAELLGVGGAYASLYRG
jgi:ABC-type multidrug transport system fused ATPase/permease subunit